MTVFDHTATTRRSPFAPLLRVVAAVLEWNDRRVNRKAFSSLTDRELGDIGLIRSDVEGL